MTIATIHGTRKIDCVQYNNITFRYYFRNFQPIVCIHDLSLENYL